MKLQIEPHHLELVLSILGPYALHVSVFGSRAKGTARPLSDLDLVLRMPIAPSETARLRAAFEESKLPYKVDLVLLSDLDSHFLKQIENDFTPLTTTAPTP